MKASGGGHGRAGAIVTTGANDAEIPWFVELDLDAGAPAAEPVSLEAIVPTADVNSGYTHWEMTPGHGGWLVALSSGADARTVTMFWVRAGEAAVRLDHDLYADNYDLPPDIVATPEGFHVAVGGSNITTVDVSFE